MTKFPAKSFYDSIADKYNWFFSSRDRIMEREVNEIKPILDKYGAKTILDCSCGDGLQAIALAKQGYHVVGGDLSAGMLKKAAEYAEKEDIKIVFEQADFRELDKTFTDTYDCVLSWGNAIPHLMTRSDIKRAVSSIYNRINPEGIALIQMRNYDDMLETKRRFHPMRINDIQDGFRYSILYVFDYLPDLIRFNIVYLMENIETGEKRMEQESVDYNPIKKADFIACLEEAGFVNIEAREMNPDICYIAQK